MNPRTVMLDDKVIQNSASRRDTRSLINGLLRERFSEVRNRTVRLCFPLEIEDFVVQPVVEVSPPKWHLGHTTWFFEHFILGKFSPGYREFDRNYSLIFNSYYKSAGEHWRQESRGVLSRPTVADVYAYRDYVDSHLIDLMNQIPVSEEIWFVLETGINHEQQHQELLLMDIKYILGMSPFRSTYLDSASDQIMADTPAWKEIDAGNYEIGSDSGSFTFDNERPRHTVFLNRCSVSSRLVTNEEYQEFILEGGYSRPEFWLNKGWSWIGENRIKMPLYWFQKGNALYEYTLNGARPLSGPAPVCHISYFEADAFARWKGLRLPTEHEFEIFLRNNADSRDNVRHPCFDNILHPRTSASTANQLWCWTKSQYDAYPGFQAFAGDLGEYNGKFMCNQFVLKGGCVATPRGHYRNTYRNFFEPQQRWMFSGVCLARD